MNSKEITVAKFNACMTYSIQKIDPFKLDIQKEIHEYNFQEFNKIMIKHDMDEYSDLLFNYFINILIINSLNAKNTINMDSQENDEFCLDLLKSLHFLTNHPKEKTISINISKSTDKYSITNERLIFESENYLQKLYKNYFKTMYSIEELDEELLDKKNKEWITIWVKHNEIQGLDSNDALYEKIEEGKTYYSNLSNEHLSGKEIRENIKNDFRMSHSKVKELNIENIKDLIVEFENRLAKKQGADVKNQHLTILAYELSDLWRINKFLNDKNITEIDQIGATNKQYRFIYNFLDFWGFIYDKDKKTSPHENYISSIIRQGIKLLPPEYNTQRQQNLTSLKEQLSHFNPL